MDAMFWTKIDRCQLCASSADAPSVSRTARTPDRHRQEGGDDEPKATTSSSSASGSARRSAARSVVASSPVARRC